MLFFEFFLIIFCTAATAFIVQVVKCGLRVDKALDATHHPCTKTHLYRLIKAARAKLATTAKEGASAILNEVIDVESPSSNTTISSLTPPRSSRKRKREINGRSDITKAALRKIEEGGVLATMDKKKIRAIEEGLEETVESLLSLASSSKSAAPTKKPPRQTAKQAAHHRSFLKTTKNDNKKRYSAALKEATKLCASGGGSLRKIARKMNTKYELEGKWQLTHETIRKYCDPNHPGQVDSSPLKQGPKPTLPPLFLDLLQSHVSMCQLSGNGECKPKRLKAIIGAAIANTKYKDELTVEYIYRELKNKFPETVQQSKPMQIKDCWMNWTTYPNLNAWFDGAKATLIQYGYAKDKPQLVRDIFKGHPLPCEIPGESVIIITFLLLCS